MTLMWTQKKKKNTVPIFIYLFFWDKKWSSPKNLNVIERKKMNRLVEREREAVELEPLRHGVSTPSSLSRHRLTVCILKVPWWVQNKLTHFVDPWHIFIFYVFSVSKSKRQLCLLIGSIFLRTFPKISLLYQHVFVHQASTHYFIHYNS